MEGASGTGSESEGQEQRGEGGQPSGRPGESGEMDGNKDAGEAGGGDAKRRSSSGKGQPGAEPTKDQSPVSPEGDNDGEAFERIDKFLRQRGELDEQEQRDQQPPNRDQAESSDRADGEPASDVGELSRAADGERPNDAQRKDNADSESRDQSGSSQQNRGAGPGAETMPGQPTRQPDQQEQGEAAGEQDESASPGGQQTSSKGPSGAGDQPADDQGAPDSEPGTKPADKWQQRPSDGPESDDQEPPSTGRGKRESDSQGEQGGDRAGGGQEGGGQQAPREGTGSAGQNQSADEGAGESSEQGAGRDSSDAGWDATADKQTGQSGGDERGEGSQQREGQGDQAGGEDGGQAGGEDAPARSEDKAHKDAPARSEERQESERRGEPTENSSGTSTGGGGLPGEGTIEPQPVGGDAPDADAANLDYARKQTDLVLEKLAEQLKRKQVDQELLDRLGWTEVQLRQFVERWQQLKAAARNDEPSADAARRELDDTLRSLGLRRGPLQQNDAKDDELRDLREGYRGPVPLKYQDRLRAYNEGISRSRQDGE
jgi:hypothetical protein